MNWQPTGEVYDLTSHDISTDIAEIRGRVLPHIEGLRSHDWIISTVVGIRLWDRSYIALSSQNAGGQDAQYQATLFVMATGKRGEISQEYYDSFSCMNDLGKITDAKIAELFESVIHHLDSLLDAPISPSGEMDIVIATEAGGVIIHEAVGHGLEGDLQASSAYANQVGQRVAGSKVNIIDDPTMAGLRGSYNIDHEGHPAVRAELIRDGILQNYMQQQSSAQFLELPHNGHGRRESYSHEAIVRMSNTYMDNGSDLPADIIASVQDGLYVTSMGGGQVNTTSGDFVFKVNYARRIRDGKLAEVVRGANLAGNGPKMLQEITMVGNDLDLQSLDYFCGGTCGKDGQGMPVTDANPTIKVRLRVTG